jgi:hypothetical protein
MYLNSGLLARSHYASRRSCDRPNWWGLSVYILGPRANSEFVPRFYISHSLIDLPIQTSKFCPIAALQKGLHSRSSVIMQPSQYRVQNSAQIQQMFNLFRALRVKSCPVLLTPRLLHFPTPPIFIYEKNEWPLPGNPQNRKITCFCLLNEAIPTLASQLSFISLCLLRVLYGGFTHIFKEMLIWFPKLSLLQNASLANVPSEIKQNGLPRSVVTKICSDDICRGSLDTFI